MQQTVFLVTAASMNSILSYKLFCKLHFRNVFSTEAHSQTLFTQFASTNLNLSEADITRILKSQPQLQNLRNLQNVEKIVDSFQKRGFSQVQIAKILTRNSRFLCSSLENHILPTMEFLKNLFRSQDVLVNALLRAPRLLNYSLEKTLKPSLAFWEGWGFSGTELVSFLQVNPHVLIRSSLIPAQVALINKIGVDKESKMYKYIVSNVAMSRAETIEDKIDNLKLCGLSPGEIWQLLGASPAVFCLSKENVRAKMNFLVNNVELPANCVVKHPLLLRLSLENTMRPRFLVWQKIKSINDLNLSPLTVLWMSEARFVSKILEGHPASKTLCAIYESALSNASSRTKSSENTNFWMAK